MKCYDEILKCKYLSIKMIILKSLGLDYIPVLN